MSTQNVFRALLRSVLSIGSIAGVTLMSMEHVGFIWCADCGRLHCLRAWNCPTSWFCLADLAGTSERWVFGLHSDFSPASACALAKWGHERSLNAHPGAEGERLRSDFG